jgi:hypothetical protein
VLEEEGDEVLGLRKSERRTATSPRGCRNGHRKPRQLALLNITVTDRRLGRWTESPARRGERASPIGRELGHGAG